VDDETFTKSFTEFYGNKWAVLGGVYLTDIFAVDNLNFRMEASRVEPYVYTHKYHINRYMNLDNFLGGKYGPDSESLEFELDYRPLSDLYLKFGYEHASVGQPLKDKEDQPNYGTDVKSFLRGIVEKHRLFTFEASYQYNKFLELTGYYSHQEIINHDHTNKLYINNSLTAGFNLQVENYYTKYFKESK
jgi:predicted porin